MFFFLDFIICSFDSFNLAKSIENTLRQITTDKTISNIKMNLYDPCKIDALRKYILYDPNQKPNCLRTRVVNLISNPETHTGYRYGAKQVWQHLMDADRSEIYKKMMNALQFSIQIHVCSFYYFQNNKYTKNSNLFKKLYKKTDHLDFEWLFNYIYYQFCMIDFDKIQLPDQLRKNLQICKQSLHKKVKKINSEFNFESVFDKCFSIMNCVGCEKCKLWGKIQIRGLLTASKIEHKKFENNFSNFVFFINLMQRLTVSAIETEKFLNEKQNVNVVKK